MVKTDSGVRRWRLFWSKDAILGILMVSPLMLWLAGTMLYPLLSAVQMSFFDVGIIGTGGHFVGLTNYIYILSSTGFWNSLWRSVEWSLANGILQMGTALITALILNQTFRGQGFARIWIILSWIVPTVVTVIIWSWLLGTSGGIVNYLLVALGIIPSPIGFFGTKSMAFISVTVINSWRMFPLMGIMLLAGLQGIPGELYEAAKVDGASSWQRLIYITIPGLRSVLFVLALISTLWSVNLFDVIWLMTGGGPSNATATLPIYIYETAFNAYRLSRASAASFLFGLFLLGFVVLYFRSLSAGSEEENQNA